MDILLEAIPSYGSQINFEIVSSPAHGTLANLRTLSDHTASVTYRHDTGSEPREDRFYFKAQAPGRSKSARSIARISVIPSPAKLLLEPGLIDFGKVMLGDKASASLMLLNTGGTRVSGRISLPPEVMATNGEGFSLGEGEGKTFRLEFSPRGDGSFSSLCSCLPNQGAEPAMFRGEGIPCFAVEKKSASELLIKNLSGKVRKIVLSGAEGWIFPREIALHPGAESVVTLQPDPDFRPNEQRRASVPVFVSDGLSNRRVEIPGAPGVPPLIIRKADSPWLANHEAGVSLSVSFSVTNPSTSPRRMIWSARSDCGGVLSGATTLELGAGESRIISLDWVPVRTGPEVLRVVVEEGKVDPEEIIWKTTVIAPRSAMVGVTEQAEPPESGEDNPPDGAGLGLSTAAIYPEVVGLDSGSTFPWFGKSRSFVSWKEDRSATRTVCLYERVFLPKESEPTGTHPGGLPGLSGMQIVVTPLSLIPRSKGGRQVIEIPRLTAGIHHFTLCLYSGNSEELAASSEFMIQVPRPPSLWSVCKISLCLLLILSLLVILRRRLS